MFHIYFDIVDNFGLEKESQKKLTETGVYSKTNYRLPKYSSVFHDVVRESWFVHTQEIGESVY